MEMVKTTNTKVTKKDQEQPNALEQYNIILKLYKGLFDNIEDLYKKSKDNKSGTVTSQLAYKVDRIAAGLQSTLKFDDEHSRKISENFRDLYRHVRFSMKMIYEKQEYKFLESSRNIAKTLYESWSKIKPSI